jgi:hypothetical protein
MRIIVEEIVKAHPAGSKAGSYQRVERVSPIVDAAAATLLVDNESTELWIADERLKQTRRCVNILTHRVVASAKDDEIVLIVDVADQEICKEIQTATGRTSPYERDSALDERGYIAWAKKHEVWP